MQTFFIPLTNHYTDLVISGKDAESFLQGQLTCDVKKIEESHSMLGAHCNLKGRMVSLFRIYRREDTFHLILPVDLVDIAEKALKHYARFSKVMIKQEKPERFGIIGKKLEKNGIQHSDNRTEYLGAPEGIYPTGSIEDWRLAQIQEGEVFLTSETSGKFLPHEINLPQLGGVSFTKGCFLGQEIVARMEYLGKLKKHMNLVELPTDQTIVCQAKNFALVN